MDPWNPCPTHQINQLPWLGTWEALASLKPHLLFSNSHKIWQNNEHLGGWLSNSIYTSKICTQYRYHYDEHKRAIITRLKNRQHLELGQTATNNPIRTTRIQVWRIPKELFHIVHKLFPLVRWKIWWYQIALQIISEVGKPWDDIIEINQNIFIWEHIISLTLVTNQKLCIILQSRQVIDRKHGSLSPCALSPQNEILTTTIHT